MVNGQWSLKVLTPQVFRNQKLASPGKLRLGDRLEQPLTGNGGLVFAENLLIIITTLVRKVGKEL
jgi:hypothetical protein